MLQLKILGYRKVTRSHFSTEDPRVLGATAQSLSSCGLVAFTLQVRQPKPFLLIHVTRTVHPIFHDFMALIIFGEGCNVCNSYHQHRVTVPLLFPNILLSTLPSKILNIGLERPKCHVRTEQQVPRASREVKNFKQTLMFNIYLKPEQMKQ